MRKNVLLIVMFAALSMSIVTGCTKGCGMTALTRQMALDCVLAQHLRWLMP